MHPPAKQGGEVAELLHVVRENNGVKGTILIIDAKIQEGIAPPGGENVEHAALDTACLADVVGRITEVVAIAPRRRIRPPRWRMRQKP